MTKYRIIETTDGEAPLGEVVKFYFDFFLVGLRLPLDPFICKFLDANRARPEDLTLNLVRALVGFATIARCFGFNPSVDLFAQFYTISVDSRIGRLGGRLKTGGIQFFPEPPNKIDNWSSSSRAMLIESSEGWGFIV